MNSRWERIVYWLFPAREAWDADADIDPIVTANKDGGPLTEAEAAIRADINKVSDPKEFAAIVKALNDSENKRREQIEAKADSIIQSAGIVTAIFSSVPMVSGKKWEGNDQCRAVLSIVFALTVINLFMAIYMAMQSRRLGRVYLPTVADVEEMLLQDPNSLSQAAAHCELSRCKRNEAIIGMKANRLVAAEAHYIRGLICFTCAFFVGLFGS